MTKTELEKKVQYLENEKKDLAEALKATEARAQGLANRVQDLEIEKRNLAEALKVTERESNLLKQNKRAVENPPQNPDQGEVQHLRGENEKMLTRIRDLESIEQRRVKELNEFIFAYDNLIKSIQSLANTAGLLNDKMVAEVTK